METLGIEIITHTPTATIAIVGAVALAVAATVGAARAARSREWSTVAALIVAGVVLPAAVMVGGRPVMTDSEETMAALSAHYGVEIDPADGRGEDQVFAVFEDGTRVPVEVLLEGGRAALVVGDNDDALVELEVAGA